jgi:hypothetical protein
MIRRLIERLIGPILDFAGERLADELLRAGYATRPAAVDLPCSGFGHSEAARAGGKSRDDPFSHGPYGDWPAIPEDLKSHRFHSERNTL